MDCKGLILIENHDLSRLLELPDGVVITGVEYDYKTGDVHVVLRSSKPEGTFTCEASSYDNVRRRIYRSVRTAFAQN